MHKGEHFTASSGLPNTTKIKAIVFDLDETLGHFSNLREISETIEELMQRPLKQMEFDELLNLYPEFLRPGILTILEFLYYKKTQGAPRTSKRRRPGTPAEESRKRTKESKDLHTESP